MNMKMEIYAAFFIFSATFLGSLAIAIDERQQCEGNSKLNGDCERFCKVVDGGFPCLTIQNKRISCRCLPSIKKPQQPSLFSANRTDGGLRIKRTVHYFFSSPPAPTTVGNILNVTEVPTTVNITTDNHLNASEVNSSEELSNGSQSNLDTKDAFESEGGLRISRSIGIFAPKAATGNSTDQPSMFNNPAGLFGGGFNHGPFWNDNNGSHRHNFSHSGFPGFFGGTHHQLFWQPHNATIMDTQSFPVNHNVSVSSLSGNKSSQHLMAQNFTSPAMNLSSNVFNATF